jgi:3-oxoadipate enol-lactonase/4-carboxymuconolactone decarboxylase
VSAVPVLASAKLSEASDVWKPLLVLGPSLGTSASSLWGPGAAALTDAFDVLAWDLPGHGTSAPATDDFSIAELAGGVLNLVEDVLLHRGQPGGQFHYAGDSVGGAVGLQLLLDHPGRVSTATLLCTGARIGSRESWSERAEQVRIGGTAAVVEGSKARWFAPGFIERCPEVAATLLDALRQADDSSYARVCNALADFDVREGLSCITPPVLVVAGAYDEVTPVASLQEIADGIGKSFLVVLDDVAHLAPAEAPDKVAGLVAGHVRRSQTRAGAHAAGMAVRRAVLGDAHVDRSISSTTEFTRDFQDLITEYAWGSIWTRPGLDRRSRSLITLTALVARGHHEELAMHVRAARTNGLSNDEIKEVLLQTAIYCGVPDANAAFRIAQSVLSELDAPSAEEKS